MFSGVAVDAESIERRVSLIGQAQRTALEAHVLTEYDPEERFTDRSATHPLFQGVFVLRAGPASLCTLPYSETEDEPSGVFSDIDFSGVTSASPARESAADDDSFSESGQGGDDEPVEREVSTRITMESPLGKWIRRLRGRKPIDTALEYPSIRAWATEAPWRDSLELPLESLVRIEGPDPTADTQDAKASDRAILFVDHTEYLPYGVWRHLKFRETRVGQLFPPTELWGMYHEPDGSLLELEAAVRDALVDVYEDDPSVLVCGAPE